MNQNLLIFLTITITAASSQTLPPGLVTTMIQDLLSPTNTKQVLINKRNIQKPVRRFAITDVPKTVKTEPKRILVQNPIGVYPNNVVAIQKPEAAGQRKVIVQKGNIPGDRIILGNQPILKTVEGVPRNAVIRKDVPTRVVVTEAILKPQFKPTNAQQKILVNEPKKVYPVTTLPTLAKMAPTLPPLTKVATALPPQSRGQFLRKIPIPPPTL